MSKRKPITTTTNPASAAARAMAHARWAKRTPRERSAHAAAMAKARWAKKKEEGA